MLTNTFCHIPGVGPGTERKLWAAGLCSWDAACGAGEMPLSARRAESVRRHARESADRLAVEDSDYFYGQLPSAEQWRMFREFRHAVAYVDIETTGLGSPGDYITAITLYDGRRIRCYVYDENLEAFADDVAEYRVLVTYNGKTFDAPFIRSYLNVRLDQAHIDLRYVLASLGYRGGLKGCEKQLGLQRDGLEDVDGFFAVLLWRDWYNNANDKARETLLAYNIADTVNLAALMVRAYNLKLQGTPFAGSHRLPAPAEPDLPYEPDAETIARIRREHGW